MKDWTGNFNSIFKQLGASNHSSEEREIFDYYATDPKAISDLLKYEKFNHYIWECASGGGHLVSALRSYGYCVYSSDIINRGAQDEILDFLKYNSSVKWLGDIITNPPYRYCTEFILKALDSVKEGAKVAMFLKLTTLEGQTRYKKIFKNNPPIYIYIVKGFSVLKMEILRVLLRFVMLGLYGKKGLKVNLK